MSKMTKEFAEKYLKKGLDSLLKQEMRRLIWSRLAFHRQMKTNGKMRMLKNWTKKASGLM